MHRVDFDRTPRLVITLPPDEISPRVRLVRASGKAHLSLEFVKLMLEECALSIA
jgi:hypothetical protein